MEPRHGRGRALRAGVPGRGGHTGLIVRRAEAADAPAIAAIYAHWVVTSAATFHETPPTDEEIADKIESILSVPLPFLVAESEGRIDGYAHLSTYIPRGAYRHTAECSIYLAPEARRRGIGRALLDRLLDEGRQLGVREVIAIVAVTDDPASVALPLACGFREVGRLGAVGFKHGRWYDTLLLQRSLR